MDGNNKNESGSDEFQQEIHLPWAVVDVLHTCKIPIKKMVRRSTYKTSYAKETLDKGQIRCG